MLQLITEHAIKLLDNMKQQIKLEIITIVASHEVKTNTYILISYHTTIQE